jgi:Flp pilus assembly protein TadB
VTHAGAAAVPIAYAALGAIFLALFLVAMLVISSVHRAGRGKSLSYRIEPHRPHQQTARNEQSEKASTTVRWARRLLQSRNAERRLAERLDLAGIRREPAEWVVLGAVACLLPSVILTVLFHSPIAGPLIGIVAGWLGMRFAVSFRISRRRAQFGEQLPAALQLIAGSLQAGFSLPQALDAVVGEDAQPAAGEISRALAEARIGVGLEDALDGVADRMDSRDMRWTTMAIRIQREVGGNLAEVLGNAVDTMRERAYLHRHVRALSAEGRLSAYILAGLPVGIGGWLFLSRREYLRPLYTTSFGMIMLVIAGVLFVVGALWMKKLIKVVV